ncbi:kxDL motif-containing protein LO9-177-like [Aristolochia californica]|uniref:kxDL motif-containing protein LO9-177-like n=1 Tax=Aristolochia californica TaxID=171875 RepID=UPI0035DA9BC9
MESREKSLKAASVEVARQFKSLVDADDIESIKHFQNLILGRLQDGNAVLSHFNDYSEQCYAAVSGEIAKNARLLKSMKSDLDYIFQKLRSMKARISATYPDAFSDDSVSKILDQRPDLEMPQQ